MSTESRIAGAYLYQVLAKPRRLMGIDPKLATIIWAPSVWMALVFKSPWWLPFVWLGMAMLLHAIARFASKREPDIFLIYKKYSKQADYYSAWPLYKPKRGLRPSGFGRQEWKA